MTILELLVALAILGILAAISLPGFMDSMGRMAAKSAARSLTNTLSLARSEAVKTGSEVSVCATEDGLDCIAGSWNTGWLVFIDNNGDADGDTGSIDADDTVLRVYEPLAGMSVSVSPATDILRYDNKGYGRNSSAVSFSLCPLDGIVTNSRLIEISLSGRARTTEGAGSC